MSTRCRVVISVMAASAVGLAPTACKKTAAPPVAAKNGAEGLRELFANARAACDSKEYAKGRAIVASIIPTRDQAQRAMRDGVSTELLDKIAAQSNDVPTDDAKAACILSPSGRTEVLVHAATTEDIVAYQPGSIVEKEFPSGAKSLAPLMRPAMTFYEVETVEPGKDTGTKFHLFYWDDRQWRMLGPAWRYLEDQQISP